MPEYNRILQEAFDMYNRGEVDAFLDLFTKDAIYIDAFGNESDREGFRRTNANCVEAFGNQSWQIERMVSQDDTVWMESTWTATHHRAYLGIPATNKTVKLQMVNIIDIEAGKVKRWKNFINVLRLKLILRRASLSVES